MKWLGYFMCLVSAGGGITPAFASVTDQKPLSDEPGDSRNPFTHKFKAYASDTLEKWHLPGMAIAVIDGNETFYQGLGLSNLKSQTPVTESTLFMTGSTTKAFTDAVLGILIASGNYSSFEKDNKPLSWTTPLSAILPEDFVMSSDWATRHLTLDDAVSHRTGLPRHDKASGRFYPTSSDYPSSSSSPQKWHTATPRDVVRSLRYLPLTYEPRTKWQYCNLMYVALTHVVQTITNQKMGSLLRDLIWGPLGMDSTYYGIEEVTGDKKLATGYYWDETSQKHGVLPIVEQPEIAGAGLVISSVADYSRWIRSLVEMSGPLGTEVHREVRRVRMVEGDSKETEGPFDGPTAYAAGWTVGSYRGKRFFTHGGMMEAFGTTVVWFPEERYGVVSMGNTAVEGCAVGEVLVWGLVDERFGVGRGERFDWGGKWSKVKQIIADKIDNAVEVLFPDHPEKPLPPSRPLDHYTGTYFHPAYLNMTIELGTDKDTLRADRTAFTWQTISDFKHVSGEWWVMYSTLSHANGSRVLVDIAKVEFKVGVSDKVSSVGVEWRETIGDEIEGLIWYERVD
ncbi:beta-lactamase/transpeptidase-like protein [Echria macrotheca]|uniref:Beta-lactamase/transpeptidase-like protein n=1 Tax=Echria macrotheca TaxID=438768 RepID=A0AAJ0F8Z6_9PEZI|nr:beta-lactamase/transpeptidase-like protein [Echria macrotheca]